MEKGYIKNQLQDLLDRIPDFFEPDELAYYSAHCKNEQQIRDKIAWELHKVITQNSAHGDKYVVRREWAPEGSGRSRVDLAILEMDAAKEKVEKVIALIEFKAQSIARREKWYLNEFTRDIEKMRGFKRSSKECNDAELFFVFLETGQGKKAKNYKSVLAFSKYESGCVFCNGPQDKTYLQAVRSHWNDFESLHGEQINIPEPIAIEIGAAFGYEQYVSPLLIGPLE
ncbi:MAG: hypothetical protein J5917_05265 [Bacteroidales bacterium]|nr:hypothetical protein [Bacteroidales bacterium]